MSFNFPNSPAVNDSFTPVGGPTYQWDGTVWRMSGTAGALVTAQSYNRVVNGAMQISQENGNTVVTNGFYPVDQWVLVSGTSGTMQTQRVQVTTPKGSKDRLRVAVSVADASMTTNEQISILQAIEGSRMADFCYGSASAKQAILRFGFRGPAGTYAVSIRNSADSRSFVAMFTITAGQASTDTEQVIVVPGDTTGTWLNDTGIGCRVCFIFASGPTFIGAAGWQAGTFMATSALTNNVAVAGSQFEIFDVGFYLDPQSTGVASPWQMPDYAQELMACQRYWQRRTNAVNPSATWFGWSLPVEMRVNPAITGGSTGFSVITPDPAMVLTQQDVRGLQQLTFNARM